MHDVAEARKPSIEEIRARLAAASPGPWWFDAGQDWGASWGIVSGTGDHMRYVAKPYGDEDRAAITAYPTDIAFLLERDAARERRLAELEAELSTLKMVITDFADDHLGLQEVAPPDELLSRVGKRIFELRQDCGKAEAELAGVRERARAQIAEKQREIATDPHFSEGPGAPWWRETIAVVEHVVGDLGEPAAREGEGDA